MLWERGGGEVKVPWYDNLDAGSPAYAIAADTSRFVRVVAGPGTGKSFALKRRVARLLEGGVAPRAILPVTFTNVAAEDLQREMLQVGVDGCREIRGCTLHSLGMRILAKDGVLQATGRYPRPLNDFETEPLLYDLPDTFGDKRRRKKRIRAYEAAWARLQHEQPGYAITRDDQLFEQALLSWLRFHEGMLIGEIVPQLYDYLRNNPTAPERNLYTHVLVDEYQDLNKAEQALIDLLSGNSELCIVGDDDQSLYSFKHAHPDGIRTFDASHAGTRDHEVLQCRRCPTGVVELANALIANNRDRVARRLTPTPGNGPGDIRIIQYSGLQQEAQGIASIVQSLIAAGRQPQDILVLAQRRGIGNPIHDRLRVLQIPSKSYYAEGALDRPEAQERLAIFKLVVNQNDRIALRWLIGLGSNDFRSGAFARVRSHCEMHGMSPWSVLDHLDRGVLNVRHTTQLVERFREIRVEVERLRATQTVSEFVDAWLDASVPELQDFRILVVGLIPNAENLPELLKCVIEVVSTPEIPPDVTEVRIMSLHKSKGLSSPVVIIAGCIEGLLPARPDEDDTPAEQAAKLEEQRRLFYVGITRVKAEPSSGREGVLILTSSRQMTFGDAKQAGIVPATSSTYGPVTMHASRFLRELGPTAPPAVRG